MHTNFQLIIDSYIIISLTQNSRVVFQTLGHSTHILRTIYWSETFLTQI